MHQGLSDAGLWGVLPSAFRTFGGTRSTRKSEPDCESSSGDEGRGTSDWKSAWSASALGSCTNVAHNVAFMVCSPLWGSRLNPQSDHPDMLQTRRKCLRRRAPGSFHNRGLNGSEHRLHSCVRVSSERLNGILEDIRAGFTVVPRSVDLGCTRPEKAGGGGDTQLYMTVSRASDF